MRFIQLFSIALILSLATSLSVKASQPLTFEDVMKFRQIEQTKISENGQWIALSAEPDRGDSEGLLYSASSQSKFSVERGIQPQLSKNGNFALFKQDFSLVAKTNIKPKKLKEKLHSWVLIDTANNNKETFENYHNASLDVTGQWLALHNKYKKPESKQDSDGKDKEESSETNESVAKTETKQTKESKKENEKNEKKQKSDKKEKKAFEPKDEQIGAELVIKSLSTDKEFKLSHILKYAFSPTGKYLVAYQATPKAKDNKLVLLSLKDGKQEVLKKADYGMSQLLSWHEDEDLLAFNWGNMQVDDKKRQFELFVWKKNSVKQVKWKQTEWSMKGHNKVIWSKNTKQLHIGLFPMTKENQWKLPEQENQETEEQEKQDKTLAQIMTSDDIIEERGLTIWHGDDPYIKPHEKKQYKEFEKRDYWFTYNLKSRKTIQLANKTQFQINPDIHNSWQLMRDTLPYSKLVTYDGFYADLYAIDSASGKRVKVATKVSSHAAISPNGKWVVYYHDKQYHLFDTKRKKTYDLTSQLSVQFDNELHDYPSAPSGYEISGWASDSSKVYINDRFDIWQFKVSNRSAKNLTKGEGRKQNLELRRVHTDQNSSYVNKSNKWLVKGYFDQKKNHGFFELATKSGQLKPLLVDNKAYRFLQKPKDSKNYFFTQEDFQEFPDIWVTNSSFTEKQKVTSINPQIADYAWGQKPELIEWTSTTGKPLQGVLIKPHGYKEGDKVPVLVYYYRYFSQRMYLFNRMEVNHRPNFPYYSSNGYAVFLPDVKFDIGTPGPSATQALVPGVQKLVDMGIADPNAIGLHGHSWSGYQTAFVITQTNMFKAAVAGAPVSNMTSAYSGIRHRSGLARQFQYEKSQSRIGGSLNEKRELYIENSPVFFADRIHTPLLIMFGDVDGAVPWEQGIELYLAMRREEKDVIFLQYHKEPHHLKKYPNKVDYSIRMKQYFDYHLKGTPAPEWIKSGEAYEPKEKE